MGRESFMPMFVGDFMASTAEWPGGARGLYANLLFHQWAIGSLPVAARSLQELCKLTANEWRQYWPIVAAKFVEREGRLYNERLEEHRLKAQRISDMRAQLGRAGGQKSAVVRASNSLSKSEPIASRFAAPSNPILTREDKDQEKEPPLPPLRGAINEELVKFELPIPVIAKRRKASTLEPIDYPPELNREAWTMWSNYRRTEKRKPIRNFVRAMNDLTSFGDHAAQMLAVEHSMKKDYTGLYAPTGRDSPKLAGGYQSAEDRAKAAFMSRPERKTE